jgi:secreted trypsin-like serine protease
MLRAMIAFLVAAALVAGSTPTLSTDPGSGVSVVGGDPVTPGSFPEVVAIVAGAQFCTGVVVAPTIVLTSGSCLVDVETADDLAVFPGDEVDPAAEIAVSDYAVHPEFCVACSTEIHDYGYLVTEQAFAPPFGQPIATVAERDEVLVEGTPVTVVGFGEDPEAASGEEIGIKREVAVAIGKVSPDQLEFSAGGNGRDTCQGDGGAPALARLDNDRIVVAGIVSRGPDPCGSGTRYSSAFGPLCWIEERTGVALPSDCPGCACGAEPPATSSSAGAQTGGDTDPAQDEEDAREACACHGPGTTAPGPGLLLLCAIWIHRFRSNRHVSPAGRSTGPR